MPSPGSSDRSRASILALLSRDYFDHLCGSIIAEELRGVYAARPASGWYNDRRSRSNVTTFERSNLRQDLPQRPNRVGVGVWGRAAPAPTPLPPPPIDCKARGGAMESQSAALIAQIDQLAVPPGQLALWALGQAGFVIKGGGTIAYVDPYLSDSITAAGGPRRRFPSPLDPAAVRHAQVVFATHEHMDHDDPGTLRPLMAASPHATLVTSPQGRAL